MGLVCLGCSYIITVTHSWPVMYMSLVAPLITMEAKGYIDLKLFFLFTEILAPYSYILLGLAHVAFLVVFKNTLVSNVIDLLSGNFIPQSGKKGVAKLSSLILPKSYFETLSLSYTNYVRFLESFRI